MHFTRCLICYRKISIRVIKNHYYKKHSKQQLIETLIFTNNLTVKRRIEKNRTEEPRVLIQSFERRDTSTTVTNETLYIEGSLSLTYGTKEVSIEPLGENDLDISITDSDIRNIKNEEFFSEKQSLPFHMKVVARKKKFPMLTRSQTRQAQQKKPAKKGIFCLKFNSTVNSKTLNERNGNFYNCNCMIKESKMDRNQNRIVTTTSDTESSSDNGIQYVYNKAERRFFCDVCGNGYKTKSKLAHHCKVQHLFCEVCKQYFTNQSNYSNHMNRHRLLIYVCHICQSEYIKKKMLMDHLSNHQEREIINTVLDLEENYSHYLVDVSSNSSPINSIENYLMQGCPINRFNYRNIVPTVRCTICMKQFYQQDYDEHMRMHYSHPFLTAFDYFTR